MLSIDIGSSQTRMAMMDGSCSWPRHLEPLGEKSILSVLYHEPPTNRFGRAALTRPARHCGRVLQDFSRIILASSMGEAGQDRYHSYTLKADGSYCCYVIGQEEVAVQEVLREFLMAVLAEVPSLLDEELSSLVLPVPDGLTATAREVHARAAQEALAACGMSKRGAANGIRVTIVPSTLGPAILFASQQEEKMNLDPFIILDFGGGKLTCAAYEVVAGKIRLLATKTCPTLGGIEIENRVMSWISKKLDVPVLDCSIAKFKLRKVIAAAVRDLTVADMVEIESENIMGNDVSVELSKNEFVEMMSDVAEMVVHHVTDLAGQIENFPEEGVKVILLGGSSRIPLIESILASLIWRDSHWSAFEQCDGKCDKFEEDLGDKVFSLRENKRRVRMETTGRGKRRLTCVPIIPVCASAHSA
eukprot:767263-Hanusia_phi.AAC.6